MPDPWPPVPPAPNTVPSQPGPDLLTSAEGAAAETVAALVLLGAANQLQGIIDHVDAEIDQIEASVEQLRRRRAEAQRQRVCVETVAARLELS
jgi:hypothetical protein